MALNPSLKLFLNCIVLHKMFSGRKLQEFGRDIMICLDMCSFGTLQSDLLGLAIGLFDRISDMSKTMA